VKIEVVKLPCVRDRAIRLQLPWLEIWIVCVVRRRQMARMCCELLSERESVLIMSQANGSGATWGAVVVVVVVVWLTLWAGSRHCVPS